MTIDYAALGDAMLKGVEAGTVYPNEPLYSAEIDGGMAIVVARCTDSEWRQRGVVLVRVARSRDPSRRDSRDEVFDCRILVDFLRTEPEACARALVQMARE